MDPWMIVAGALLFVAPPLGLLSWLGAIVRDELRRPRVPVLMYHRFVAQRSLDAGELIEEERVWVVTDLELEDQCRSLRAAGYEAIDLDQLVAGFEGRAPLPNKPIVFTFDDGYTSCIEIATPTLERHGMRGVFYVVLEPDEHSRELVQGKDGWLAPDQLRSMHAAGHTIGSHTITHGLLSEMDDAGVRWELTESKRRLEEILGAEVAHFCIPRAGGNRKIERMTAVAGYRTCTGSGKGTANPGRDLLHLPRIGVPRGQSGARLVARLEPLRAARERLLAEIRMIPTRLLGPSAGYRIRQVLYGGPIRRALLQDRLGVLVGIAACGWVGLGVAWLMALR